VLRDLIGERAIEDLPISFTAAATNINEQREVWLNRDPLFDAIRASIAIPMLFTPHRCLGMTLFDGGIVNPIPIAPTLNDCTDLSIAVDLGARPEFARPPPTRHRGATRGNGGYHQRIAAFIDGPQ
jgi:NTE family protein